MTMKRIRQAAAPLTVLALAAVALTGGTNQRIATPRVVEVRMVDFGFEPADITVAPGDRIRFIQVTTNPHNVEFREAPEAARWGDPGAPVTTVDVILGGDQTPPRMGPLMIGDGVTYEMTIGEGFALGTYVIVCTPHETQGMKGTLTVVAEK